MTIEKRWILMRRILKSLLLIVVFLLLVLMCFVYIEPPFIILGDNDVLDKLHINVGMSRYNWHGAYSEFKTIFLDGGSRTINNQDVDRFGFYVNYDNKLFTYYEYDNIPKMMNDASEARNTLLFCKVGSDIFLFNRFIDPVKKCDGMEMKDEAKLLPLEDVLEAKRADLKHSAEINTKEREEEFLRGFKQSFFDINE